MWFVPGAQSIVPQRTMSQMNAAFSTDMCALPTLPRLVASSVAPFVGSL